MAAPDPNRPDLKAHGEKLLKHLRRQYHRSLWTIEGMTPTQRALRLETAERAASEARRTADIFYRQWAKQNHVRPHPASLNWDAYDAMQTLNQETTPCPTH